MVCDFHTSLRRQGNHTTFTPSLARKPGAGGRDFLCALFHLSPEKYAEMMIELHEKTSAGEDSVQVNQTCRSSILWNLPVALGDRNSILDASPGTLH